MPWSHCASTSIPDTDPCPACGLSKVEWTVELDRTRTLRVGEKSSRRLPKRDAWLELALLDAAGAPVAGARYQVSLPNGRVLTGALDDRGQARLEGLPPGACEVAFPDHAPAGLERETGARHELRLGGVLLEAVLRTSRGEPIERAAFVVLDASGAEVARGTTDEAGLARAGVPAAGEYRLELLDPAVEGADADEPLEEEPWERAWAAAGGA